MSPSLLISGTSEQQLNDRLQSSTPVRGCPFASIGVQHWHGCALENDLLPLSTTDLLSERTLSSAEIRACGRHWTSYCMPLPPNSVSSCGRIGMRRNARPTAQGRKLRFTDRVWLAPTGQTWSLKHLGYPPVSGRSPLAVGLRYEILRTS